MKITIKRSWIPWRKPSIEVDIGLYPNDVYISGCSKKSIFSEWEIIDLDAGTQTMIDNAVKKFRK